MTRLADLKAGGFVVSRGSPDQEIVRVRMKIKRMNKQTLTTTDGTLWDLTTGRMRDDPGYGYSLVIEPFDRNVHPYLDGAAEARVLLFDLITLSADPQKVRALAEQLPLLRGVLKSVEGGPGP